MPSLYKDRDARLRRQREHVRRKVLCAVCEQTFEVFRANVNNAKYCRLSCRREGARRLARLRDAGRGPYSHHKGGRSNYDAEASRRSYLARRAEVLARQKAQRQTEEYKRRKRDYNRRRSAVRQGKTRFAEAGAFSLVRVGSYWRVEAEGVPVQKHECIMARYWQADGAWHVLLPALASKPVQQFVTRLAVQEQRRQEATHA